VIDLSQVVDIWRRICGNNNYLIQRFVNLTSDIREILDSMWTFGEPAWLRRRRLAEGSLIKGEAYDQRALNKLALAGVELQHFKAKDDCQPFRSRPDYAQ